MPQRLEQLVRWLRQDLGLSAFELTPASSDASFRRYFRVRFDGETRIAMDAPPEREGLDAFIHVAGRFAEIGLNVPVVEQQHRELGFLLLSDLGDLCYLDALDSGSAERLYGDALGALVTLQACGPGPDELPPYSKELLHAEMELFREWFLRRHMGIEPTEAEHRMLDETFAGLIAAALEQPQVAVHRDYHSRNLMVCAHNPGILDFQDAVHGPVTYDLVSLLRDAYIEWPQAQVEEWVAGYHDLAVDSGILRAPCEQQFARWFDLMGAQRHLKVLGIFARLNYRDGKPGYLRDLPLTLKYLLHEAARHESLSGLHEFLEERVLPRIGGQ